MAGRLPLFVICRTGLHDLYCVVDTALYDMDETEFPLLRDQRLYM